MARTRPTPKVRHKRKRQLAARDGWHCTYCHVRFHTHTEATIDHVVPYRLLRTWAMSALVLACRPCNQRKGDRFPLSIALSLLRSADPARPGIRPTDLPWLARLAHANQSADAAMWSADPDMAESTAHGPTLERTAA